MSHHVSQSFSQMSRLPPPSPTSLFKAARFKELQKRTFKYAFQAAELSSPRIQTMSTLITHTHTHGLRDFTYGDTRRESAHTSLPEDVCATSGAGDPRPASPEGIS